MHEYVDEFTRSNFGCSYHSYISPNGIAYPPPPLLPPPPSHFRQSRRVFLKFGSVVSKVSFMAGLQPISPSNKTVAMARSNRFVKEQLIFKYAHWTHCIQTSNCSSRKHVFVGSKYSFHFVKKTLCILYLSDCFEASYFAFSSLLSDPQNLRGDRRGPASCMYSDITRKEKIRISRESTGLMRILGG